MRFLFAVFLVTSFNFLFSQNIKVSRQFTLKGYRFLAICELQPINQVFSSRVTFSRKRIPKDISRRASQVARSFCTNKNSEFILAGRQALENLLAFNQPVLSGQRMQRCKEVPSSSLNSQNYVFAALSSQALRYSIQCELSRYPLNVNLLIENGQVCLHVTGIVAPGQSSLNCSFSFTSSAGNFFVSSFTYTFVNGSAPHSWGLDGNPISLAKYEGVFNRQKAAHLLRKIGLGATKAELDFAEQFGLDAFVNKLVDDCDWSNQNSKLRQLDPAAQLVRTKAQIPRWVAPAGGQAHWEKAPIQSYTRDTMESLNNYLFYHFLNGSPLCASMWVILHNWFALQHNALDLNRYPALSGDYVDLIIQHLVGDFRNLVIKMHGNAHMLVWLDNRFNRRGFFHKNDNYARELAELFTLKTNDLFAGNFETYVPNYSELDIQHLTRAAVGYQEYEATNGQQAPYGQPYKFIPVAKDFCRERRVRVTYGSGANEMFSIISFPDNYFYSSSCMSSTLTSERRFGFNKALWDRTGTQEEEIFRNGVKLFQGTAWELRDDMVQNGLNINSFSHIFSSNNQGIPQNPSFWSGGPHFIYDNVTSHLLLNHRRIPAAGSTASRALAIQLLGYFVGPKAARNPILVAELAEKIWEEGFNLKEPLKMLLKSEAIFSPEHVETVVKTPFEFALKIGRTLKIPQQYLYRLAQNWIVTTNFLNQISSWTGFDNLNMPSVFGVPIAGVQRNMGIFDGRAFISPVNTVLRRRRVSMLQRNIFQLYTRGAYPPNLSRQIQITDESSSGQITFPSVYFNQDDAFGDDGTWWSDISYLVFGEHYSYNPTNFPWQKYSGNIFYHYENLSNEFNNIDDIDEILNETLLRLGTPLSNTQKELARKYLTRLHPQEERPCWNNFVTTTVTINGVPVTMTAAEAKRRYFDMKYIGMVYALLMTPDAWIK